MARNNGKTKALKVMYYTGPTINDERKVALRNALGRLDVLDVQIDFCLKMLKDSIK
jgi:hypothetical protein